MASRRLVGSSGFDMRRLERRQKEAEWVSEEKERIGSTKLQKDRRCWRGAALRRLRQATNQGWNQVPGSWPLWAVHVSAKTRVSEAREV